MIIVHFGFMGGSQWHREPRAEGREPRHRGTVGPRPVTRSFCLITGLQLAWIFKLNGLGTYHFDGRQHGVRITLIEIIIGIFL